MQKLYLQVSIIENKVNKHDKILKSNLLLNLEVIIVILNMIFEVNGVDIISVIVSIISIIISIIAFRYPYKKKMKINCEESSKCYLENENNKKVIINKKSLKITMINVGNQRIKFNDQRIYFSKNKFESIIDQELNILNDFIESGESIVLNYNLDFLQILLKNNKNKINVNKKLTLSFKEENGKNHNIKTNFKIKDIINFNKDYLVERQFLKEENSVSINEL